MTKQRMPKYEEFFKEDEMQGLKVMSVSGKQVKVAFADQKKTIMIIPKSHVVVMEDQ